MRELDVDDFGVDGFDDCTRVAVDAVMMGLADLISSWTRSTIRSIPQFFFLFEKQKMTVVGVLVILNSKII